jgi:ABC-type bacteriocin/lantibiotic exporter with double-glycine peptidase domain
MMSKAIKLVVLLMIVGFSSCTITKKYHSFGYHIESNFPKKASHREAKPAKMASGNLANNTIANKVILSEELHEATSLTEISDVVKPVVVNLVVNPENINSDLTIPVHANEGVKSVNPNNAEKYGRQKDLFSAKKKFQEKERKRPNFGLKGFLMLVVAFLIIALGIEILSFFLVILGLLIFAMGASVILYSIIRPRK